MVDAGVAAVVLAGGRSRRMGRDKAWLEWDGETLLARTVRVLAEAGARRVVVVRAAGQVLPHLDRDVRVVDDLRPDRGPLHALARGLSILDVDKDVDVAFVAATDLPLLQPAFVRRVWAGLRAAPRSELAVPVVGGEWHVLAAAYRTSLAGDAQAASDARQPRVRDFVRARRVTVLDETDLLGDPALAAADPTLASLTNVNLPRDLARARNARSG